MRRPKPPTYRTTNWHDYNAALARRGSLSIWFDPETQWLAAPTGKRGRQPVFTDAAIQACLTLKALFGLPLWQATGLVASLFELAGLDWPVPDFSTLSRRQKTLTVHIPYRPSTGALHLLIDSTGVKAEGDGEWSAKKHGPSKPRDWRKVHLGIDAETQEIRAIEITGSRVGDAPMLPDLLNQIPDDQPLGIVTADGAYDTRACHAAIAARGAAALAIGLEPMAPQWLAPAPQERQAMEGNHRRGDGAQRRSAQLPPPWPGHLEALDRLSPTKSGRSKDALPQAPGRARHVSRLRPPGRRASDQGVRRRTRTNGVRLLTLNRFTSLGTPLTQRAG